MSIIQKQAGNKKKETLLEWKYCSMREGWTLGRFCGLISHPSMVRGWGNLMCSPTDSFSFRAAARSLSLSSSHGTTGRSERQMSLHVYDINTKFATWILFYYLTALILINSISVLSLLFFLAFFFFTFCISFTCFREPTPNKISSLLRINSQFRDSFL